MDVERGTENEELENAYLSIRGYDQSEETAGSRLLLRSRARKMAPAPEPEKAEWEDEGSLMNAIRPTINVPMIFTGGS